MSYGENCWYIHDQSLKESDATIKCNFCEDKFKTKYHLMHHKKIKHVDKVKMCMNEKKECIFGSDKCWFLHSENIEDEYNIAKSKV